MWHGIHIQPVGFSHERTGADEQITKARPRANTTMAVMIGVRRDQVLGIVVLSSEEYLIPGHQHLVKMADGNALPIF